MSCPSTLIYKLFIHLMPRQHTTCVMSYYYWICSVLYNITSYPKVLYGIILYFNILHLLILCYTYYTNVITRKTIMNSKLYFISKQWLYTVNKLSWFHLLNFWCSTSPTLSCENSLYKVYNYLKLYRELEYII